LFEELAQVENSNHGDNPTTNNKNSISISSNNILPTNEMGNITQLTEADFVLNHENLDTEL